MTSTSPENLETPNLSIVIPAYNAQETLEQCLTAIFSAVGSRKDCEIIVVDDGSRDRTSEIARHFPVRLLQSPQNEGRIQAREKGARAAKADRILFVDARIRIPDTTLDTLSALNYEPVMGGTATLNVQDGSALDRGLYLIRKHIYAPFYPQTEPIIRLTAQNFDRLPKGMGSFYVDKTRFLNALPDNRGNQVNDDTRLFKRMVEEKEILISGEIRQVYMHRQKAWQAYRHIFERGPLFADFYLQPGNKYYAFWIFSCLLAAAALAVTLWMPQTLFAVIGLALSALSIVSFRLAEKPADVFRLSAVLPAIGFLFGLGILKGKLVGFARAPAKTRNRRLALVLIGAAAVYLLGQKSLPEFPQAGWRLAPLLALIHLAMLAVNGLVLKSFLKAFGVQLTHKEGFGLAAMTAMTSYLASSAGGMTLRAAVLKQKFEFPYTRFLAVLTTNYLLNFFLAALLGLALCPVLQIRSEQPGWLPVFFAAIAISTLVLLRCRMVFPGKSGRIYDLVRSIYEGWDFLRLRRRTLGLVALLLTANFGLHALSLKVGFTLFSVSLQPRHALLMAVLLSFSILFAVTPANLGIQEAATALISHLVGYGFYQGLAVVAITRVISMVNIFVLGPIFSYQLLKKT